MVAASYYYYYDEISFSVLQLQAVESVIIPTLIFKKYGFIPKPLVFMRAGPLKLTLIQP